MKNIDRMFVLTGLVFLLMTLFGLCYRGWPNQTGNTNAASRIGRWQQDSARA